MRALLRGIKRYAHYGCAEALQNQLVESTGLVAGIQIATFPKCGGVNRRSIAVCNYRKKWSNTIDFTWSLFGDYPRRQQWGTAHNARKSGARNVPFFHPGSRLAVMHALIFGYWSHPTGQAACEREPARGGSSGGRGGGSRICWRQNDLVRTERLVSASDSRNQWLMSDCQVTWLDACASSECCIKHVASKLMTCCSNVIQLRPLQKLWTIGAFIRFLAKCIDSHPPSTHSTVLLLPPRPHY